MRCLSKGLIAALFCGTSAASAEPLVFHSETFGDQTTVTMALTSRSALLQQEYDYGVTIKLIETHGTELVYHDNGLHKALVKCREIPGKIFVGGKEYSVVPEKDATAPDKWKNDLWRAVCQEPPVS
jgi:hypothetical protein